MAKSFHLTNIEFYNDVGSSTYLHPTTVSVWCRQNFGPEGKILPRLWLPETGKPWAEGGVWLSGASRVFFADIFDAYVFKMRWLLTAREEAERREAVLQRMGKTYRDLLYGRYELLWPRSGSNIGEVMEWCHLHMGPPSRQPKIVRTGRWIDAGDAVYIRDANDAFAFKMRWG